jgi:cell division protein FtsB
MSARRRLRAATRRTYEYFGVEGIAYASERRKRESDLETELAELRREVEHLRREVAELRGRRFS